MKERFSLGKKCLVVAEISANHGQSFSRALSLIKKAKSCGVDAVKFQTYTPDTITINASNKYFRIEHSKWRGQTLYQLYKKAYTPWQWFPKLKKYADDLGISFFSTAFDKTSVDFLEKLKIPVHKIASFELVDLPLIDYIARTKKPLIMSTGMATLEEIKEAVDTARKAGAENIILLRCVSDYPADPVAMNLRTIPYLVKLFGYPVGLSDHTLDSTVSIVAVAQGARMIEKHFTLSRKIKTPDSFFSLEPFELKELVAKIRLTEAILGGLSFKLSKKEKKNKIFRRSLFTVRDIKKGEIFSEENVWSIRPGYGLPPKYFKKILGKKAVRGIRTGTPLKWEFLE
jgi:pseudaminic acid synthase